MELQPGFRLLPVQTAGEAATSVDLYLYDTADGGAGYAAEAATRIEAILETALQLVEGCPTNCVQSCTRCMRHYGNRLVQHRLDRRLAAHLLRYARDGVAPTMPNLDQQAQQLEPLARFLELARRRVERGSSAPLLVHPTGADRPIPPKRRSQRNCCQTTR
jgi:ATP-dependent helicase YprA (DUF1998 family)